MICDVLSIYLEGLLCHLCAEDIGSEKEPSKATATYLQRDLNRFQEVAIQYNQMCGSPEHYCRLSLRALIQSRHIQEFII